MISAVKRVIGTILPFPENWLRILVLILLIVSLLPIWSNHFYPSQNGPENLLFVKMMKDLHNPAYNYDQFYEFYFVLVPNLMTQLIVLIFSYFFPILIAHKIQLSITALLLPISTFYFLRCSGARNLSLGIASIAYVYNYFMLKGYDSFLFSVAIFFFFFGYFLKHADNLTRKNVAILSLLILVAYFSHLFAFLLAGFTVLIYLIFIRRDRNLLVKMSIAFLPTILFFSQYFWQLINQKRTLVHTNQFWLRFDPIRETITLYIKMAFFSLSEKALYGFLLVVAIVAGTFLKSVFGWIKDYREAKNGQTGTGLLPKYYLIFYVFALSILFFLLPREVAGWPKLNMRVLPFLLIFMIAASAPFYSEKMRRLVVGVLTVLILVITGIITSAVSTQSRQVEDYASGIDLIEKNKIILPLRLEDYKVGLIRPVHWAFNYYNIFKGGATGKSVVQYTGRVPMKYKASVKDNFPDLDPARPHLSNWAGIKKNYDYILCWGENQKIFSLLEENGFGLFHHKGKMTIFKNSLMMP